MISAPNSENPNASDQINAIPPEASKETVSAKLPDPKHCAVLHRRPLIPSRRLSERSPVEVVLDLSHDGCIRGEIQFKETDERIKLFVKPNRS
jgi:hypothetical protein